jgi:hypothetical protein
MKTTVLLTVVGGRTVYAQDPSSLH